MKRKDNLPPSREGLRKHHKRNYVPTVWVTTKELAINEISVKDNGQASLKKYWIQSISALLHMTHEVGNELWGYH